MPQKCTQVAQKLKHAYPCVRTIRLNKPSEAIFERINRRVGKDIAFVMVVTHSGPGTDDDWDVWNCEMQPEDIADAFDDEWVIWSGCYSRAICEHADNLLPVQSEVECLEYWDETWTKVIRCIETTANRPMTKEQICRTVFRDKWKPGK